MGTVKASLSANETENVGTIGTNFADLDKNSGEITTANSGTITENSGTISGNSGAVTTNTFEGTVTNTTGSVENNYGTVTEADGTTHYGVELINNDTEEGEDSSKLVQAYKDDKTVLGAVFSRDGYTLAGYSSTSGATSAEYDTISGYSISNPLKLYAVWTEKSTPAPAPAPSGDAGSGSSYSGSTTPAPKSTVPTFQAEVKETAGSFEVTLTNVSSKGVALYCDGVKIDESNYVITYDEDGNLIITFTEEYLASLSSGDYDYTLLCEEIAIAYLKLTID